MVYIFCGHFFFLKDVIFVELDPYSIFFVDCYMPQLIDQGNVTCQGRFLPDVGEYLVASGNTCQLYCRPGFVSLELKTTRCLSGRWSRRLACVRPDAMLIIGGRSNTQAGRMLKADFQLARLFTIPNISILSQYCSVLLK